MKEITRSQEEILKIMWLITDGTVSDIKRHLPDPKPAYTTIATVIKVLEKKGYVAHKKYGKTYVYFPIVSKKDYTHYLFNNNVIGLFNYSYRQLMSFVIKNNRLSINELEEIKHIVKKEIQKQKK